MICNCGGDLDKTIHGDYYCKLCKKFVKQDKKCKKCGGKIVESNQNSLCENCGEIKNIEKPITIFETTKNFVSDMVDFAKSGFKVDEDLSKERLSVCQTCSEFDFVKKRCNKCSCHMEIKTKIVSSKCPLDKWRK